MPSVTEDRTGSAGQRLGDSNEFEAVQQRQRDRGQRHHYCGGDHQAALRSRAIDQRAGRRLRQDPGGGGDRHHQTDRRLVPVLHRQQVDRQIRSEPVTNIGKKEVEGVERPVEVGLLFRRHANLWAPRKVRRQPIRCQAGSAPRLVIADLTG
jgi:hypothetical protein